VLASLSGLASPIPPRRKAVPETPPSSGQPFNSPGSGAPTGPMRVIAKSQALAATTLADSAFAHDPSFHDLRAVMGDEKANRFIANIGEAALRAAPGGLNVPLGTIVSMTLSRLTHADLASIARGDMGAINRAQSIAADQVKTQESQRVAANIHGPGATATMAWEPRRARREFLALAHGAVVQEAVLRQMAWVEVAVCARQLPMITPAALRATLAWDRMACSPDSIIRCSRTSSVGRDLSRYCPG
jgi:hypothetical protein